MAERRGALDGGGASRRGEGPVSGPVGGGEGGAGAGGGWGMGRVGRKGYAGGLVCEECGGTARCPRWGSGMRWEERRGHRAVQPHSSQNSSPA